MTSELQLPKDSPFYASIIAPGYTTYLDYDGSVDVAYYLTKAPPTIKAVFTWTAYNDIDSYVYANNGISYWRERDITNAPGGEIITVTDFVSGTKFLLTAHLYSSSGFA